MTRVIKRIRGYGLFARDSSFTGAYEKAPSIFQIFKNPTLFELSINLIFNKLTETNRIEINRQTFRLGDQLPHLI